MKNILFVISTLFFIAGCSPSNDDLFNEAKEAESQKNFPVALERYAKIVENDSQSALAESSQYRIALIYNNELRDIPKAAEAYRKFNSLFPNSHDAPTCLFLAGFLYNNDMKRHDMAKEIYQEFMQKYPNHELVASAKFELETMGKDPVELLQKDTTTHIAGQPGNEGKKQ
ncbi:MAG: tetratricopeptide repeat protein [Bacteroidetes bacterium]|nr:MAG: tetratricopeptide repeat protein [Bacteroidota bacterium]